MAHGLFGPVAFAQFGLLLGLVVLCVFLSSGPQGSLCPLSTHNTHTITRRTIPPHTSVQDTKDDTTPGGTQQAARGEQCWSRPAILACPVDDQAQQLVLSCLHLVWLCFERPVPRLNTRVQATPTTGTREQGWAACVRTSNASARLARLAAELVLAWGGEAAGLLCVGSHACLCSPAGLWIGACCEVCGPAALRSLILLFA